MLTVCYINRQPGRGYYYSETNTCGESAASNKGLMSSAMLQTSLSSGCKKGKTSLGSFLCVASKCNINVVLRL